MTMWQRAEVLDEYAEDGEGVLLLPSGQVIALQPVAWSLWLVLREGSRRSEVLAAALVDEHGTPHDEHGNDLSVELTVALLEELAEHGVVAASRDESP